MPDLRFGTDTSLNLPLESGTLVAHCQAPRGKPLAHVERAVADALANPLEFPLLAQAALPGDKVVLALDRGLPHAATIVAKVVEQLLAAGVEAADIALVRAPVDAPMGTADARDELPADVRDAVESHVHDPANRQSLGYLGATADGRPIYINRAIHDADLVIPIGVLRLAESLGYHGVSSTLFPALSDTASLVRFRSPKANEPARQSLLQKEADEMAWLLGVQFTIQVVPGAAGDMLHVLAGDPRAVFREGCRLCAAAWDFQVPQRAGLVIATLEGDASQQTWENVGRALAAVNDAVDDDGDVVICSQLAEPFGAGLQELVGADDLNGALREIARHRPVDALAATQLVRALERGKVYLVSRLDDEWVEGLGVLPLDEQGVSRVAGRYRSCIVLANAANARLHAHSESMADQPAGERRSRS